MITIGPVMPDWARVAMGEMNEFAPLEYGWQRLTTLGTWLTIHQAVEYEPRVPKGRIIRLYRTPAWGCVPPVDE